MKRHLNNKIVFHWKASLYSLVPFDFHYWIGLNDVAQTGVWVWQDSFEVADYTSWGTGEPLTDLDYHCALLVLF